MTDKKRKSYLLPLLLALIIVIGGIGVWYSMQEAKKPVEPPFIKEGRLTFGSKDSTGAFLPKVSIDIEVAATPFETSRGLMYRQSMDEMQGMLFIFQQMEEQSFWMKNTYISLDIIYTDDKGKIVSIQADAAPLSEKQLPSFKPAQYVVEVNAGFCVRHGVGLGDLIDVKFDE